MTKEMFVQFSKKAVVNEVMKKTGMSKKHAVKAVEELEQAHLVYFPEAGGLRLKVVGGY